MTRTLTITVGSRTRTVDVPAGDDEALANALQDVIELLSDAEQTRSGRLVEILLVQATAAALAASMSETLFMFCAGRVWHVAEATITEIFKRGGNA